MTVGATIGDKPENIGGGQAARVADIISARRFAGYRQNHRSLNASTGQGYSSGRRL
jgi:hypothetical protein